MDYILTIDNFYPNPDLVREVSIKDEGENKRYDPPRVQIKNVNGEEIVEYVDGWRGYRSIFSFSLENSPLVDIREKVCEHYKINAEDYEIETFLHYSTVETKSTCFPSFEEYKFHTDPLVDYAGVIYLHPNPPQNTGTTIVDPKTNKKIYIDNVYNRLLCYPGNVLHGPTDLFGHDLESGRLTITFFLYNKKVYERIQIKRQDLYDPERKKQNIEIKSPEVVISQNKGIKKFIV